MIYGEFIRQRGEVVTLVPPFVKKPDRIPFVEKGHGEHGNPIPYSEELAEKICSTIYKALGNRVSWTFDPTPISSDKRVCDEVYRFYQALIAYQESDDPLLTVQWLVELVKRGPEGIKLLKRLRSVHLVESTGGRFLDDDPELEEARSISQKLQPLRDIGQIFNYRYFLFWDQPDEHDEQNFWIPQPRIKQSDLDRLEEAAFNLLPESDVIEVISEEEILLSNSGSNSRTPKGKSTPAWLEKQVNNHFTDKPLKGYGSYIQKCPGDTRYSITLELPHSNTVKLIEQQVARIAANVKFSNYVRDDETYFKRFHRFKKTYDHFLCRDLKKDGITKVRPAVQAILRAIKRKYPDLPASRYFGIYDGFSYVDSNGVENFPPRGVGLGMSSAITTILQSAVLSITLEDIANLKDEDTYGTIGALFYHDDAAIGFTNESDIEVYDQVEDEVFARYGFIKNKKKSFQAEWFVLCENYSDEDIDQKDSYQRVILRYPHCAVNITHAKILFASNLRLVDTVDWQDYLHELIDHFGIEFHINETQSSYQLGGWVPAYYMNVDIGLTLPDSLSYLEKAAGLSALQYPVQWKSCRKRFKDKPYLPPVKTVFPHIDNFGNAEKAYMVGMTELQVAESYHSLKNSAGSTSYYWGQQLKKRKEAFERWRTVRLTMPEFYMEYHKKHPGVDILPPREVILFEDVANYPEIEEFYKPSNPFLQFLKFHNPTKIRDDIMPWPLPPGMSLDSKLQLTAEERRQLQYSPLLLARYNWLNELHLQIPTKRYIPSTQFYNTHQVIAATMALYGKEQLPIGLERSDLVGFRKDVKSSFYKKTVTHLKVLELLCQKIGWHAAKDIELTYFAEDIEQFTRAKNTAYQATRARVLELMRRDRLMLGEVLAIDFDEELPTGSIESAIEFGSEVSRDSQFVWTDSPLADDEFFSWTTSKKNYRDWRQRIFESIEGKLTGTNAIYYTGEPEERQALQEEESPYALNETEKYFYELAGGNVWSNNVPDVAKAAVDEMESVHSDDGNEGGGFWSDDQSGSGGDINALGW